MNHDLNAIDAIAAVDAENSLIGALLLDNGAWDRIGALMKAEYFYGDQNRMIFAELSAQLNAGKRADVVTVSIALGDRCTMAEVHALAQYVPSSANIRRYADLVIERFKSRQLLAVSSEISELATAHTVSISDRVDRAQSQLAKLIEDAPRDEWLGAHEAMVLHTQVLEDRAAGNLRVMGTGLSDLDEYLEGGLRPGELVIVGARPSMGKTALGLSIGVHMAAKYGIGLLSMEMSHSEVNDRLTAMLGSVSLSSVKRPSKGGGLQWDRVIEGVDRAKTLNLHTSDQGGLNINQVRSKARNLKRLHGLDVLIVDYIGLMSGLDSKANRNTQLEEISRGLKGLAKELGICVLCLAQLNRKSEERPDQMPMMSDLRDSGAIEQDADLIIFIKRPIMANPELGDEWKHYAKLSVAKNRQGRCGYLNLSYIGDQTKFSGWAGEPPRKQATAHRGGGL
ncbi:replicative DNA helicase [Variovorax sp. GT1P44]|uniref:replicative DNA helicase n=1 Tax=Variovorax sp. GT1P44 TaxID=3443742 RepID=UPI003F47BC37